MYLEPDKPNAGADLFSGITFTENTFGLYWPGPGSFITRGHCARIAQFIRSPAVWDRTWPS